MDARYTVISCSHITVTYAHHTGVHACIVSHLLSYDSPCILPRLLFHVTVAMLYDCFRLLIWIFPILDMRAVDMLYVDFHIYCSRFLLYCSCYIVPVSRYIVLCYQQSSGPVNPVTRIMYCIYSCYIVYLPYQIIKLTCVWGRLDG